MEKKICVITGTRAEYGLLYWVLKEIQNDPSLTLQIIVTGTHLSPAFDNTYQIIEKDGFRINKKIEILLSSDTPIGISKSIALGVIGFAEALDDLKPDILVILGDRFEMLAAAQAALIANVPIAHIHGGETTEGAIDEAIRHSITKMSYLHFVAAEPYHKRVIQLGEAPNRVFNFGAPGLDHIKNTPLLTREEFEQAINFNLSELNFLVTLHPTTLKIHETEDTIVALLAALDSFPDGNIIFTGYNADPAGHIIGEHIDKYVRLHNTRCRFFKSLGQVRYLSALQFVDVIIGNSSSGLSEVPVFRKPTVNIGDRQKGRLRATSVIDCTNDKKSIIRSIKLALSDGFQTKLKSTVTPYGMGNVSPRIKDTLKSFDFGADPQKRFFDISFDMPSA